MYLMEITGAFFASAKTLTSAFLLLMLFKEGRSQRPCVMVTYIMLYTFIPKTTAILLWPDVQRISLKSSNDFKTTKYNFIFGAGEQPFEL